MREYFRPSPLTHSTYIPGFRGVGRGREEERGRAGKKEEGITLIFERTRSSRSFHFAGKRSLKTNNVRKGNGNEEGGWKRQKRDGEKEDDI